MFGAVITEKTVTAYVNGKVHTIQSDHQNFQKAKEAAQASDAKTFLSLIDIPKVIKSFTKGKAEVKDGVVYFNGNPVDNSVTQHILRLQAEGKPFQLYVNFFEKLMQNPSMRSVNELYGWAQRQGLMICEDGDMLGLKRVREDYLDVHSGKIDNRVGAKIPRLERNQCDDNWRVDCSNGYHVGGPSYVSTFHGGKGHVMLVKFNPADVISVPSSETNKMRICFYEVIDEVKLDEFKHDAPLYTDEGKVYEGDFEGDTEENEDDWFYGDEDDQDEDNDENEEDDSELEEEESEDKPSFVPKFKKGDRVYHEGNPNNVYTVDEDSFIPPLGEELVRMTHNGFQDSYAAKYFKLAR